MILAQVNPLDPIFWLFLFFLIGLAIIIALGGIILVVFSLQNRRIRRRAAEAGIPDPLPKSDTGFDSSTIKGIVCGIVIVIIIIAGALILPTLPEGFETILLIVGLVVTNAFMWGIIVYSIWWMTREYTRREQLLKDALGGKSYYNSN